MKRTLLVIWALLLVLAVASPAFVCAQEPININYVTFVPRMHGISKVLLADLKEIETKSGGKLKFTYRAVKKGAVDMCMTSPDFYGKMVKGMEMLVLSKNPVAKHRESGLYDFLNSVYNKVGIKFLYMVPKEQGTMFHFFTKKAIRTPAEWRFSST